MRTAPTRRFLAETALAVTSAVFLLLTLLWKDWIELVLRVDPDRGSGSLEWSIAGVSLLLALGFGARARCDRPRVEGVAKG